MTHKNGTIAWIRPSENSEWILAFARDHTWEHLATGTMRLNNGFSDLADPVEIQPIEPPR